MVSNVFFHTAKFILIGHIMIPVPENILYHTKDPKTLRYSTFPLKTGSNFSSLTNFFFIR